MKSKLVLQINSLEALERLIGGDSETEMAIRDSVVVAFAEKHLKPLANSPRITEMLNGLAKSLYEGAVNSALQQVATFKNINWSSSQMEVKLRSEFVAQISTAAFDKVNHVVKLNVEAAIAAQTDAKIGKMIDDRVNFLVAERIRTGTSAKLAEIVKAAGV